MRLALKSSSPPDAVPVVRIRPPSGWAAVDWGEIWEYRELLYFLTLRDLKLRYKQASLGVAWVLLQPLASTVIFTVVFGRLARLPSDDLPYALFALSGLVPWTVFASALGRAASSLVSSANLLGKVYFPRLILPLAAVLSGLVDAAISFALLLGLAAYYGQPLSLAILAVPLFLLMALAAAVGVGLALAALYVRYRDIAYVIPVLTQLWMYASPVVYPASLFPERWRWLVGLNPMAGVVEGFRWALFGTGQPPGPLLALSAGVIVLMVGAGFYIFRRMEDTFADVV
jgi:lipopolysaccharide transport system permease protein